MSDHDDNHSDHSEIDKQWPITTSTHSAQNCCANRSVGIICNFDMEPQINNCNILSEKVMLNESDTPGSRDSVSPLAYGEYRGLNGSPLCNNNTNYERYQANISPVTPPTPVYNWSYGQTNIGYPQDHATLSTQMFDKRYDLPPMYDNFSKQQNRNHHSSPDENSDYQQPTQKHSNSATKRARTQYSSKQLVELEREFNTSKYLCRPKRIHLSTKLSLTEKQIKVWFQNRRMKAKKEGSKKSSSHNEHSSSPDVSSSSTYSSPKEILATRNPSSVIVPRIMAPLPTAQKQNSSPTPLYSNTTSWNTSYTPPPMCPPQIYSSPGLTTEAYSYPDYAQQYNFDNFNQEYSLRTIQEQDAPPNQTQNYLHVKKEVLSELSPRDESFEEERSEQLTPNPSITISWEGNQYYRHIMTSATNSLTEL